MNRKAAYALLSALLWLSCGSEEEDPKDDAPPGCWVTEREIKETCYLPVDVPGVDRKGERVTTITRLCCEDSGCETKSVFEGPCRAK